MKRGKAKRSRGGRWFRWPFAADERGVLRRPTLIEALEARWLCSTTFTVINTNDSGAGSFRQAILDANNTAGADTIAFAIPGVGVHTIQPATALPAITETVTIDATTQSGYAGTPLIRLDAGNNGNPTTNAVALTFSNINNNTVKGLSITRWAYAMFFDNSTAGVGNNTITGNYIGVSTDGRTAAGQQFAGIYLYHSNNNTISSNVISGNGVTTPNSGVFGDTSSGNIFIGNFIGTDSNGTARVANTAQGIYLLNGQNNRVGTNGDGVNDAAERNVISGNAFEGLVFSGGAGGNIVAGNTIGLNASGTAVLGNGGRGIAFYSAGPNNRVGTNADGVSDTIERNIIGGNGDVGVYVDSSAANIIAGNYIGTDVTGKLSRTNSAGIYLNNAANNRIGTNGDNVNDAAERNVISGNAGDGIDINGGGTNVIAGNYVGLEAGGTAVLANTANGLAVFGASSGNRIGVNAADANPAAERNIISGNAFAGISLFSSSANKIAGNYIGTDPTGKIARGNLSQGVVLFGGAVSNQITQNVISANGGVSGFAGLELSGANLTGNIVQGNFIGTDAGGTAKLANSGDGVLIHGGATNNLIGSNFDGQSDTAERNIISGNNSAGVEIDDAGTTLNKVAGNYIGTDITGKLGLGNTVQGVFIGFGASANTVDRNVIAGNSPATNFAGLEIYSSATANIVIGNFIGVDATGTNLLGNGGDAVLLHFGAANNRIGTNGDGVNDTAEANVIAASAPQFPGVEIADVNSNSNIVAGNKIGTDLTGALKLPNGGPGVFIRNGASNNQIGGPSAVFGNIIANNGSNYADLGGYHYDDAPGVVITDPTSTGNSIRANSIYNNRGLGIDLSASPAGSFTFFDGVNYNHATNSASGPNHLQNYPVILAATAGSATAVTGRLTAVPNTSYIIDLYASSAPNPALFGDGQRYLGAVTVNTGASGAVTFNVSIAAGTAPSEYLTATATDPAGNTSEFSAARQLASANSIKLSSSSWTPLGPGPISTLGDGVITTGRVDDIVPDPSNTNTAYLVTDSGGIWKTTDWGDANPIWSPLTDSQSSLNQSVGFKTLAIAPSNTQILYDAVSGPHSGILKSTNGGATWSLLSSTQFPETTFSSVIVDPTNANIVYAGVWQTFGIANGVYKSTDGGVTWNNITTATALNDVSDLVFDPNNSQILYAGFVANIFTNNGASTAGLYKSINGGSTWAKLTTGLLPSASVGSAIRVATTPANSQVLYATEYDTTAAITRYKSVNGGTSWTPLTALPTSNDNRFTHTVLSVDPTNANIVYANADHEVYRSTDGGATWPANPFAEDPVNVRFEPTTNAVILTGDRGVYRWSGGVGPFVNKQGNLANTQNYTITLDPSDEQTVYAIAQDQGSIQRFNGISTWTVAPQGNEVGRVLVDPTNSARIYDFAAGNGIGNSDAGNAAGVVMRSDDGGATWIGKDTGLASALAVFPQAYTIQKSFVMDPANAHRLLVGIKQVYESTDNADSWHSITGNADLSANHFISAVAIAPSAPNTIYAATDDGKLFVTTNDGGVWNERDTNLPIQQFNRVINIQIDPANASRAFIVTGSDRGAFDGSHVWVTTNGGTTWTDISANLDPTVWAQTLAVDWRFTNPVLYLGTALGVQTTTYTGVTPTWSAFNSGLPNVIVEDLQLLPNSNLLAAGTYGRGTYEIRIGTPTSISLGSGANTVSIARSGANAVITVNGSPQSVPIGQASTFNIFGATGNDTLTIDFSGGNPLPAGGISFDGGGGVNTINFIGTSADDTVTAGPGGVTFSSAALGAIPVNLANTTTIQFHGGTGGNDSINLASGTWTVDADTPTGTPNVAVTVQPAAIATFPLDQHLASLSVGGLVNMSTAARRTMSLSSLTVLSSGTMNIGAGDLVFANLNGSPATATAAQTLVRQAAGAPTGVQGLNPWTGAGGITSTVVQADAAAGHTHQEAIGIKDNADYLANGGKPVAAGKVLVSFAAYGDITLDNIVDIADLSAWNNNFAVGNHWGSGDVNYDGVVDIADLSIWNNNFFNSVSPAAPAPAPASPSAPPSASSPSSSPTLSSTSTLIPTHDHAAHVRHLRHMAVSQKRARRT